MTIDANELARFIQAVQSDEPLDVARPEDRARYVEHLQGTKRDPLVRLGADIHHRLGDAVYLFTGQLGSGKSTELLRLKAELQGPACKVYYCDLEDWLNLNTPIDLASMLLALMASWVEQIGTGAGQRTPVERMADFLARTKIQVKDIKLDAGMDALKAQLQLGLKSDASFRAQLENTLKDNVSGFVAQVHAFVIEQRNELCAQGEKCVLIADSLEKIRGYGDESDKVYESVQSMFLAEGSALRLPGVHVVYSVSPYLLAQNPQLPAILGMGMVANMPSVHVFEKDSSKLDPAGIAGMKRMVDLRYPEWRNFISEDLLTELARDSGGDLRDYLRAIKIVLLELEAGDGCSHSELLDVVRSQISPPRLIPKAHIAWMARLERSHEAELDDTVNATVLQRYLASKHVLAYLNGDTWYAVHPLLRDWVLARPEAQESAAGAAG